MTMRNIRDIMCNKTFAKIRLKTFFESYIVLNKYNVYTMW